MQLNSEQEQDEVMRKKAQYLKNAKSQMGINRSRTPMQRKEDRNKGHGGKANYGPNDDDSAREKDAGQKPYRYGTACRRKDCRFNHPSNKTTESNNDQEEDVFQDAKTDDVIQDDNGESIHSNKGEE